MAKRTLLGKIFGNNSKGEKVSVWVYKKGRDVTLSYNYVDKVVHPSNLNNGSTGWVREAVICFDIKGAIFEPQI